MFPAFRFRIFAAALIAGLFTGSCSHRSAKTSQNATGPRRKPAGRAEASEIESIKINLPAAKTAEPSDSAVTSGAQADRVPYVAMLGDSFSTSFYLSSGANTVWRQWFENGPNLFLDPDSHNAVDSLFERVGRERPVYFRNFSTPLTGICAARNLPVAGSGGTIGVQPLDVQVDQLLSQKRFPDAALIWVGHHNLNWAGEYNASELDSAEKRVAILAEIREQLRVTYETQVLRLLNRAVAENRKFAIVIYGLGNVRGYLQARTMAEEIRGSDTDRFPYLAAARALTASLDPANAELTLRLADDINADLEQIVVQLRRAFAKYSKHLYIGYSAELAQAPVSVDDLHPVDGWHYSPHGHNGLAGRLLEGSREGLRFLKVLK